MHDRTDVIMGLWIGSRLSPVEVLSINSYLQNGHVFESYVYGTISNIPDGVSIKDANLIIPRQQIDSIKVVNHSNSLGVFSDLFRYKLLLDKGGWWSDLDAICLRHFDFQYEYVFMKEKGREVENVCNAIIKVPRGSLVMKYCYEKAAEMIEKGLPIQWGDTGPKLLNQAVSMFNLKDFCFPAMYFSPIGYWEINRIFGTPEIEAVTYSIHLYNEVWNLRSYPKYGIYNKNSLFEKLKKRYGVRNKIIALLIDLIGDLKKRGLLEGIKQMRRKLISLYTNSHQ